MDEANALMIFFKKTSDLNDRCIAAATKRAMEATQKERTPAERKAVMHYCNFIVDYTRKNEATILEAVKEYDRLYPFHADKKKDASQEQFQSF